VRAGTWHCLSGEPDVECPQAQEGHRALSDHGSEAAAAFFAAHVTYVDRATIRTLRGKGGRPGWTCGTATCSNVQVKHATYLDAGRWTIARFRLSGINDGDFGPFTNAGKPLDLPICELASWKGDTIVEGEAYYDVATLMNQLGFVSTSGY
jgi:hypothetical protein